MPVLNPNYISKNFKIEDIEEIGFTTMNAKCNDEGNIIHVYDPFILHLKLKDGVKKEE